MARRLSLSFFETGMGWIELWQEYKLDKYRFRESEGRFADFGVCFFLGFRRVGEG